MINCLSRSSTHRKHTASAQVIFTRSGVTHMPDSPVCEKIFTRMLHPFGGCSHPFARLDWA
jgi:hypothetical protein